MEKQPTGLWVIVIAGVLVLPLFSMQTQSMNNNYVSMADPVGWTEDIRLTNNPEADIHPKFAVHGTDIHVVWFGPVLGISTVLYMHSNDSGNTWNTPIQVTSGDGSTYPNIAVDESGKVHLVWHQERGLSYDIFYSNSTDNGQTWSPKQMISEDDSEWSQFPYIAVSGPYIHVIWMDKRNESESIPPNEEIYYRRSTDGGISWDDGLGNIGKDRRMTYAAYTSSTREIHAVGDIVHFIWGDGRDGPTRYDIYYKRSLDNGATWDDGLNNIDVDRRLTNLTTNHGDASFDVDGDALHIAWKDEIIAGVHYIYYVNSSDYGANWSSPKQISTSGLSGSPTISATNGNIHIAGLDWNDTGSTEVYYWNSTDNGVSWSTDVRLTYNGTGNLITTPEITSNDDFVHVVWRDQRDGNREIYYKRYRMPDLIPPEISHTPVLTANTSQQIIIEVNITDNENVDSVYLNYLDTTGTPNNVSMSLSGTNWSYNIPGQNNIGFVDYFIWCNDTSGNYNITMVYQIQINDVTEPEINHSPAISAFVSEGIAVTVNVTDDVQVDSVKLNYTGANGTWDNASMVKSGSDWTYSIPAQNMSGNVTYFIWANDTSDNQNRTQEYQVQINELPVPPDTEPPVITHSAITMVYVNETINITANVTDNVTVSFVQLNYTGIDGINYNITMTEWGGNYSYIIPAQGTAGNVSYFIWANDSGGNFNQTLLYQIQINELPVPPDTTAPEIQHVPISEVNTTESINITAIVTDDVEVASIFLNYTAVNGVNHTVAMGQWGDNWSYIIPGQLEGALSYQIRAVDTSGNANATVEYTVQIVEPMVPDMTPPTVISFSPVGGNVPTDARIEIVFSEPMNYTTIVESVRTTPNVAMNFCGYYNASYAIEFNLTYGTTYTVTISTDATDLAGNHLAEDYTWEFTTEEAVIIEPPERVNNAWVGLVILVITVLYLLVLKRNYK